VKIKEFEALTLKDCLSQVRQELGPEAVILETRKLRKGGILGWGARDAVRIVAGTGITVNGPAQQKRADARRGEPEARPERTPAMAVSGRGGTAVAEPPAGRAAVAEPIEDTINPVAAGPSRRDAPDIATFLARHAVAAAQSELRAPALQPELEPETREKLSRLESEMRELKAALTSIGQAQAVVRQAASGAPAGPQPYSVLRFPDLYSRLRDADVREDLITEMLDQIPDLNQWPVEVRGAMAEQSIREVMTGRIRTAASPELGRGQQRIIALIGPTGVGKTTTIAKLAAQFALIQKKRVGLITMDTYRIAAVEQLKSYSQIIGIPIEVVHNQVDVSAALKRLGDCELVLIDTAGRSQKNVMQVGELKTLVSAARCETHLVLAASTRERDLLDQVKRFSDAAVDRIIFTKLDETSTYGTLFNVAAQTGLEISYLATGQKVPEDIEAASADRLVARVLDARAE
jgi:flagellar biosynthesis protein FlhF